MQWGSLADEVLVFFLPSEAQTDVFAITHESFLWKSLPLAVEKISEGIAKFRRGLNVNVHEIKRKGELFDVERAHELYQSLLEPVNGLTKGKRHVIVVPFGAFTALPFHLITDKPKVITCRCQFKY